MIYLASSSPRRRALLKQAGIAFKILRPRYKEKTVRGLSVAALTRRHALGKALSAAEGIKEGLILGADTAVFFKGRVLGKPRSMNAARAMLGSLQGRRHSVLTAVALLRVQNGQVRAKKTFIEKTSVWLKKMDKAEIRRYQDRIGPLDKAGAYAAQAKGGIVLRVRGSFTNVVGLPMEKLKKTIRMLR